jgi:hypothetical protein
MQLLDHCPHNMWVPAQWPISFSQRNGDFVGALTGVSFFSFFIVHNCPLILNSYNYLFLQFFFCLLAFFHNRPSPPVWKSHSAYKRPAFIVNRNKGALVAYRPFQREWCSCIFALRNTRAMSDWVDGSISNVIIRKGALTTVIWLRSLGLGPFHGIIHYFIRYKMMYCDLSK